MCVRMSHFGAQEVKYVVLCGPYLRVVSYCFVTFSIRHLDIISLENAVHDTLIHVNDETLAGNVLV